MYEVGFTYLCKQLKMDGVEDCIMRSIMVFTPY